MMRSTAFTWPTKSAHGGRYIAFVRTPSQLGAGTIDLAVFLAHVRSMGLATGEEYVAAIEFGNEVISGYRRNATRRVCGFA